MVYERLPRQIKHHHVMDPSKSEDHFVLITRCLPVALLATCKSINSEAIGIVQKIQNDFILSQCQQFITSCSLLHHGAFIIMFYHLAHKSFTRAEMNPLLHKMRVSLQELCTNCLRESGVDAMVARLNAQMSRQLAYMQNSPGPRVRLPIRFMVVDDAEGTMSWEKKTQDCVATCWWLNLGHMSENTVFYCEGFLPAESFTSSGFSQDATPTRINVDSCAIPSIDDVREFAFDERDWRGSWME